MSTTSKNLPFGPMISTFAIGTNTCDTPFRHPLVRVGEASDLGDGLYHDLDGLGSASLRLGLDLRNFRAHVCEDLRSFLLGVGDHLRLHLARCTSAFRLRH